MLLLVGVPAVIYRGTAAQSVYSSSHFCERIRKKPWKARGKPEETEKHVESPRKARGNQKTASIHFNSVVFVCPLFFRFLPYFLPYFLPSFFRFSRPFSRPFSRLFFRCLRSQRCDYGDKLRQHSRYIYIFWILFFIKVCVLSGSLVRCLRQCAPRLITPNQCAPRSVCSSVKRRTAGAEAPAKLLLISQMVHIFLIFC